MSTPSYVVATDLSQASREAAQMAARLAARSGAQLDVVCVVPRDAARESGDLTERVTGVVDTMVKDLSRRGVATSGHVVTADVPSEAIVTYASRRHAEMIVAAPRGVTGWRRMVLGSVTERLMRLAPAQILLARPQRVSLNRVLIAVDRSLGAARALRKGIELAAAIGAEVRVFEVISPPGALSKLDDALSSRIEYRERKGRILRAEKDFAEWVSEFDTDGVTIDVKVAEGSAPEEILKGAEAFKASVIVLGMHGKSRTEEFFVGSVSRAVAATAPVSVLLVRARPPHRVPKGKGTAVPKEKRKKPSRARTKKKKAERKKAERKKDGKKKRLAGSK